MSVPDYHARCLRRALDQKVRRLRTMLTADEDITTELDQVVCRLMKLALRTSKGRNTPPPTRWMQCKLLDLLTLTEKTIERRKKHFIESYPLKAIDYEEKSQEMIALEKIKEDNTALKIVDKYQHLVNHTDDIDAQYRYLDFDLEDDLNSVTSTEFAKDFEFVDKRPPSPNLGPEATLPVTEMFQTDDVQPQGESKLQRTQAWVEEDIEVVPYPIHDGNFDNSSVETDHNASKFTKYYKKRYKGKQCIELNCVIRKKSHLKASKVHRTEDKSKDNSKTKLGKKVSRKKSYNSGSGVQPSHSKFVTLDYRNYSVKPRKKQHKSLYPTAAKPIPVSLIELCHPEMLIDGDAGLFNPNKDSMTKVDQDKTSYNMESGIAATKDSMLIEIVTENTQETIALRRTIGTDADADSMYFEEETLIRSVSNTFINEDDVFEKPDIATENVHSQTIFLYDIDEPTTSKGIRHIGMDVQCGPDATAPVYSMLSATTSLTKVPKMFTTGIKIDDSISHTKVPSTNFGTCTNDTVNSYKIIIPKNRSVGIKIKDSDSDIIINRLEHSIGLSATSFLNMPKILPTEMNVCNSENDDKVKHNDFGACTNTPQRICSNLNEESIGIKIIDSISIIHKQRESSTDTNDPFDYKPDISSPQTNSKVITMFESSLPKNGSKDSDKNVLANMECSTNTQKLYDKLIASSQQLFQKESEILNNPCVDIDLANFGSNPPDRDESPTKKQKIYDKSNSKQTSPKAIQKKSVDFQFQDPISHISKRVKRPTTPQKPREKQKSSTQETASNEPLTKPERKAPDAVYDSDADLLTELQCLTNTEFYEISRNSTPSPPSFSKQSTLLITKLEETCIDARIENYDSNSPEIMDSLVRTQVNNLPLILQPFSKETTLLQSHRELKINVSTSDIGVNDESDFTINNTLDNRNLQLIPAADKIVDFSERAAKNEKRKLCSGGVQVHSYRDNQALSEDIMYQGQWQQNKTKVLAKRKCCIPVVYKKNDLNLKKKVNSKERIKFSRAISNDRNRNSNKVNNGLKPKLRKPLPPRITTFVNLKQEMDIKENKQGKKLSNTVCVSTIAKPFRNILKVPSTFPISTLPTKHSNYPFIVKKSPIPSQSVKKDEKTDRQKPRKAIRKNYIPPYLRQRGLNSENNISKQDFNLSLDSATSIIKNSARNIPKPLIRSKTEEIKRDILQFRTKPLQPEYVVFRNEIEKKKSDGQQIKNTPDNVRKKDVSRQRSSTPTSANSSPCSSPCSIATVRAVSARTKNVTNLRRSSPPYVNNIANSGSENSTPDRNRKFTKRCKSARITVENKENIPQTSKHFNVGKKDSPKLGKGVFMGHKKDVYVSHVKDNLQSTANTPSKNKNPKTNINTPITVSFADKKSSPSPSPALSKKTSGMLDASLSTTHFNEVSESAQTSNVVLILEPQARQLNIPTELSKLDDVNVNDCLVTKNVDHDDTITNIVINSHSDPNIYSTMRELLEETLDFIADPLDDECIIDSDMVMVNNEDIASHVESSASPTSFKSGLTTDDNNELLPSDIEYALNRSFETTFGNESILSLDDAHFTVTDFDALSFKSITSGSKLSGYLSADNEFSSSIKLPKCSIPVPTSTSVREIFERKDQPLQPAQNQNTTGALANQAFSGFTINEDPVAGDKPDLVNLIDSETGSLLAVALPRQATSEEVLISGRSSDSFESCVLDDDTVVPNWLFQLISHQASSLDELEPPAELMIPLPAAEPLFDDNANVMEAPGAGAGAGDGRGIHSDHSQDSSGRGTSVSSSETSSGPQSEVILIDPAAFAAQFELLRDAVEGSVVLAINNPEASDNASPSRQAPPDTEPQTFSGGESRRTPRLVLTTASDADADISSLDTDEVPDLSDN